MKRKVREKAVKAEDVLVQIEEEANNKEDELNELSLAEIGQNISLKDLNLVQLMLSVHDAV